jgi:hypothetical protein
VIKDLVLESEYLGVLARFARGKARVCR